MEKVDTIWDFSGKFRHIVNSPSHKDSANAIEIFDDFAHHPTEIKYSIKSLIEKFEGKKLLSICEVKSNSMIRGTHKEELYKALKTSDLSLVISGKKIKWEFNKKNNNRIFMISSYLKINKYIRENADNIDLILIMSNTDTKNIIKYGN